jgi:hypothetical protein
MPCPWLRYLGTECKPFSHSATIRSDPPRRPTRTYWDQIGGRHVFDRTDGWDGKPPGGIDHVAVVPHRPMPEGWDPRGAVSLRRGRRGSHAKAQKLAGDRMVEVAAGDIEGRVLAAGLLDEVRR